MGKYAIYLRKFRVEMSIGEMLLLKYEFDFNSLNIGYNNVLQW
jgi:hypothetical protein